MRETCLRRFYPTQGFIALPGKWDRPRHQSADQRLSVVIIITYISCTDSPKGNQSIMKPVNCWQRQKMIAPIQLVISMNSQTSNRGSHYKLLIFQQIITFHLLLLLLLLPN